MSDPEAMWTPPGFIDAGLKARLSLPSAEGSCLSNAAYTSAEFHVTPTAAGRCRETITLYFVGEGAGGERDAAWTPVLREAVDARGVAG